MAIFVNTFDQLWYLDFRANNHMSPLRDLFNDYIPFTIPKLILLRNDNFHIAQRIGSIIL